MSATADQIEIEVHLPDGGALAGLAEDVREGLSCPFKELPPKYFYDERGSELFERITELEEYYPTRVERSLLERDAARIAPSSERVLAADPEPSSIRIPASAAATISPVRASRIERSARVG